MGGKGNDTERVREVTKTDQLCTNCLWRLATKNRPQRTEKETDCHGHKCPRNDVEICNIADIM